MTDGVPLGRAVDVRVPASSANLGPGFDTFGLALSIYDELTIMAVPGTDARVEVTGIGAGTVPEDATNLVVRSMRRAFDHLGVPMPGIHIAAKNAVPHSSGLGSSAAAIIAGLMGAKGLLERDDALTAHDLLVLATEIEGHPDNVAPALYGGLTIAWTGPHGPRAKKFNVHRGVSPLVCVPEFEVPTEVARALQPSSVPYEDAIFNLSRSALLVAALVQSPELLFEATDDRLHQDYRASAMPETHGLVQRLRRAGHAAVVSGAGPSILVLAADPAERAAAAAIVAAESRTPWRSLTPAVDFKGATVAPHRADGA